MYLNMSIASFSLSAFDIGLLSELEANLKILLEKYETFLKAVPNLIENISQARKIFEENQKRLRDSYRQSQLRFDMFDDSKTKHTEQLIERYSQEFPLLYRSNLHLISFAEKLKALLMLGQHIQPGDDNQLNTLEENVQALKELRTTLSKDSLIVTKQPSPVLMEGNSIETEVRLLANISPVPLALRIRIIKAPDAEKLTSGAATSGEIISPADIADNRAALLEYGEIWISQFKKKPLLKAIRGSLPSGRERSTKVVEEKYVLLYELVPILEKSQDMGASDQIWAVSDPIALISDSAQFSDAFATVLWKRTFNDEKATEWSRLSAVLSKLFFYLTGAKKRSLSESDLLYFRQRLGLAADSNTVSLKRFFKGNIEPDVKFSFWRWFCYVCELIKSKFLLYWEKGSLMGFDTKENLCEKVKEIFVEHKCYFFLRFSDSQLGSLSISCFDYDSAGERRHTAYLLPQERELISLATLLNNFDQLNDIQYFCDKDFNLLDKKLLLDDPELKPKESAILKRKMTVLKFIHII